MIVDTVPTGGFSFAGPAGTTVGGTVATITDPNTSATASAYTATINWGDGTNSPGTIGGSNGSFTVTGNHAYATVGSFPVAVTITSAGPGQGSSTVNDSAAITAAPSPVMTGTPSVSATGAGFSGSVDPDGLATTASFQYGLDPKYTGGGTIVYTNSTPAQTVGTDFSSHAVTASVSGLVANAVYHVRLAATNSAGTTFGPDVTFTTSHGATPGSPTLGKTFNLAPVSGTVLIKINGVFVPLTELTQIPKNTVIDALHGALSLTTAATGGSHPAHDAAKGKKPKPKPKTQKGTFGGAVFKLSQATRGAGKGLVTLTLVEGAGFKGARNLGSLQHELSNSAHLQRAGGHCVAALSRMAGALRVRWAGWRARPTNFGPLLPGPAPCSTPAPPKPNTFSSCTRVPKKAMTAARN